MLLRLGRIKAKGVKQKVRRSMLPVTRYTMKTVRVLLFLLSTSVSPPLYSAEVSKIFRSLLNSNRYRSFRDIRIRLSNLDERSNLVKLSRNERVDRRGRVELSKYRNENSESEESVCVLKRASYSTGLLICIATYTPRVTSSVCRELWQPFYAFSRIRTNRAINYQLVQEQQRPKEKLATLKPHALSIVP